MATTQRMVITNETLCKAFVITSLLTEDAAQSESVMLSVIASSDPEEISEHEFILRSASTALTAQPQECLRSPVRVPAGLTNVLRLSQSNRRCFVLRALAGISREECSRILNLDAFCVDENTALAAVELSELAFGEDSPGVYASGGARRKGNGQNPFAFLPSVAVSELNSHD